ncbi:restriction endonuclease [Clostridium felsineum]|uniref:restriction endonuclease n=1 Tax=Clostridium felsineum TaxID=36839 RepID=UPI0009D60D44|nr:restriction endonuclease [Clostridium felsineum]URZ03036.1 hypothetical protein CLAUR_030820 [Clostridium felsineum]
MVKNDEIVYPRFGVPYKKWVDEYVNNIDNKSEKEVKELIRYLLFPFTNNLDELSYKSYLAMAKTLENEQMPSESADNLKELLEGFNNIEQYRRIENGQNAWEGLTWILQLLPFNPYKAIKALNIYMYAEVSYMTDDRIIGIQQCISIIESKFIYTNKGLENIILQLNPREFECLIGSLYEDIGYETELTPATRDGGKDIIARIVREDGKEVVYAECKLYKTTELSNDTVKAFGYTVIKDNINRGGLFCTGYVNEKLKKLDSHI